MTIKEVEKKLNITRANIRFYEKEGLLQPKRCDNEYSLWIFIYRFNIFTNVDVHKN